MNISTFFPTIWRKETTKIYSQLDIIICCLQPFSFYEDDVIKNHVKVEGILVKTILKYMSELSSLLEKNFKGPLKTLALLLMSNNANELILFVILLSSFQGAKRAIFAGIWVSPLFVEKESFDWKAPSKVLKLALSIYENDGKRLMSHLW